MSPTEPENQKEVGYVIKAQDYLLYVEGLPSVRVNDILVTKTGGRAMVSSLEKDRIEVLMLDEERPKPGDYFEVFVDGLSLNLQGNLFGRMINPLGEPLDGKPSLPKGRDKIELDVVAPGIDTREVITEQFYTGITVIDTLLPIGKGQRELMFGPARSGKTSFLLDMIAHQKGKDCVCVYAAIGRSSLDVMRFHESVEKAGASEFTIIIAGTSSDAAPLISIAPRVACSVAEYFSNQGKKVLLIFDDLSAHAKYLREIGLLAGRIPGRESYPADIFYQHSQLVERAGNFNKGHGGGSITLLPVIETDLESMTNLIPTNVMSMTDGHLLFSSDIRAQGSYPAIDPDKSVTRVGRQTQTFIHKVLSDRIRSLLVDFHELERYGRFGSELTPETQLVIKRGKIAEELLRQETLVYVDPFIQIISLSIILIGFYDDKELEMVKSKKQAILECIDKNPAFQDLRPVMATIKADELMERIKKGLPALEETWRQSSISKKN